MNHNNDIYTDKYLGHPPRKLLGTILKVDERRTSTNGPDNKKTQEMM